MLNALILITGISLFFYLAFSKKLSMSKGWQATLTPLASIMGSGFLISAPLLAGVVGKYAVLSMGALLLLAYQIGSAVRFNIQYFEPNEYKKGFPQEIAFVSRIVLAIAYFITVTYYLKLLAAFALDSLGLPESIWANIITSILLLSIGGVGFTKGLNILEKIEKYAVSLNLGMVAALLLALFYYNTEKLISHSWFIPELDNSFSFRDFRVVLGLLIVVQGFETSRYLGGTYSSGLRISSMRTAQILSSIIYLLFITLSTILFSNGLKADVTAIISMVKPISVILPILLTIAAIMSQFSAAVADTSGANGLVQDLSHNKISEKLGYLIILFSTILLTWTVNINLIISYASRAFALFYTLQCLVSILTIKENKNLKNKKFLVINFSIAFLLSLLVFILGLPSE